MAFTGISGKQGAINIGGNLINLGKWKLSMKSNLPKVNNFSSAFQLLVMGLTSATITASGPYDGQANAYGGLTAGNTYAFQLIMAIGIVWNVEALIETLEPDQDIDGAGTFSITAQSTGTFTAVVS